MPDMIHILIVVLGLDLLNLVCSNLSETTQARPSHCFCFGCHIIYSHDFLHEITLHIKVHSPMKARRKIYCSLHKHSFYGRTLQEPRGTGFNR